jgi:hypothetical protein
MDASAMPEPDIVSCFLDDSFLPSLAAMRLDWGDAVAAHAWHFPEGLTINSPPPTQFGIEVRRHDCDAYTVRLLWDQTRVGWGSLTRLQLVYSSLPAVLAALGTDLQYLLNQPLVPKPAPRSTWKVG